MTRDPSGSQAIRTQAPWWRGGVIYQIYPRSFADGDGDGIGDLTGLTDRIDYVAGLGVDAVWLNPIHPSGGADGGYDVADYRTVDPVYGGIEAFDQFLKAAHQRGLKVLMDFVPHHTSDRHEWFVESRSSRDSAKRDWYVWADGREGGPPNNWLSSFRDSPWVWDERTAQFFLASFYAQQPDLDWHNPKVRDAMTAAMRFWVDRGVDGFRLDVVHRLGKDRSLRDNPPEPDEGRPGDGISGQPQYDQDRPETHDVVRAMREAVGPESLLLGEVWLLNLPHVYRYLGRQELDLAFNFPFAMAPWNSPSLASLIEQTETVFSAADEWPCYHLSNHDMPRQATRHGVQAIRSAAVLLLTLRGTAVLYQGEELGMVDGEVPPNRRHDLVGRDGCRTPMQWDGSGNAGFCPPDVEPWLPVASGFHAVNVAVEERDQDSMLALYRRLLALRRRAPALRSGRYRQVGSSSNALIYLREQGPDRFLVVLSFAKEEMEFPVWRGTVAVGTSVAREGERVGRTCQVGPGEGLVIRLD
jgi:alpha-glucosidase